MAYTIYWIRDIEPLRLAIMRRPQGGVALENEIAELKQSGVTVVVNLLENFEIKNSFLHKEGFLCTQQGIEYRAFPIQDGSTPNSEPEYFDLVAELVALVRDGHAVAVHCNAGIGRSGLTAGMILLRLGVPANEVFPTLIRARGLIVPGTTAQYAWFTSVAMRQSLITQIDNGINLKPKLKCIEVPDKPEDGLEQ